MPSQSAPSKTNRRWGLAALTMGVVWLHGWGVVHVSRAEAIVATATPRAKSIEVVAAASPAPARATPAKTIASSSEARPTSLRAPAAPARKSVPTAKAITEEALDKDRFDGTQRAGFLHTGYTPSDAATPATTEQQPEPMLIAAATPDAEPAAEPSPAVPTYRTRIPPAAVLSYRLSRSGIVGSGELDWRPEAGGYTLRLEGSVPIVGTLITQTSQGRFDAAGLAPERYTDKRLRRGELAASFQRATGVISFSGQQPPLPLTPGVQDRVSVMVQLAAIAAGWNKLPPVGDRFQVRVVGARGDSSVWSLRFEGPQSIVTPGGTVAALHFLREPEDPRDTRAEYWLDPARGHLPVRVRIADGNGDALELLRIK